MADTDAVKPIGQPLEANDLDRLKLVTRREFELILSTSDRRLKLFLTAKVVGTIRQRYR